MANTKQITDLSRRLLGRYHTFILWAVVLVLVNVAAVFLFKNIRIDLTRGGTYSLSKVSKKIVRDLKEPLYVKVFFSKNLPSPHNDTERLVRDLLTEYQIAGNRNFIVEHYDCTEGQKQAETPERIKKNLKIAQDYGINAVGLQSVQNDKVEVTKAYMGVVFQRGDIVERIADLQDTRGLEYRITSMLQGMNQKMSAILGVQGKLKVKLYFTSTLKELGSIQGVDTVVEDLQKAVKKANERNFGKLEFVPADNANNPVVEAEATGYGLQGLKWQGGVSGSGKMIPSGTGFCGVVIEYKTPQGQTRVEKVELLTSQPAFYGGRIMMMYAVPDLTKFDEYINAMVDGLLQVNEEIGYLKDKGTLSTMEMPDDPRMARFGGGGQNGEAVNFKKMLEGTYKFKEIGAAELSQNVPALIIAGPKERFSEWELYQLDQYVMAGKPLVVFLDGLKEVKNDYGGMGYGGGQSMPEYLPNDTGLERLLTHWGVTVENAYVCDTACYEAVNPRMGQKQTIYFYPEISQDRMNDKVRFLRGVKKLITIKASPVTVKDDVLKANRITATKLYGSSANAWTLREQIMLQPGFIEPPTKENRTNVPMAYMLEGEFPSYFADRGAPARDNMTNTKAPGATSAASASVSSSNVGLIKKGKKTRIIVIGSSEMVKNQILMDPAGDPPNFPWHNATFTMNVVDGAYGREDWAAMRSKAVRFNPITPYKEDANWFVKIFTHRNSFKTFNMAILPFLVIGVGLTVFLMRRSRRRRIQLRFAKAG